MSPREMIGRRVRLTGGVDREVGVLAGKTGRCVGWSMPSGPLARLWSDASLIVRLDDAGSDDPDTIFVAQGHVEEMR